MSPSLLETTAETAEERRLELLNPEYRERNGVNLRRLYEYERYPSIDSRHIRGFPDGLEVITQYGSALTEKGKELNYALLIVEGRKQVIDFYYESDKKS